MRAGKGLAPMNRDFAALRVDGPEVRDVPEGSGLRCVQDCPEGLGGGLGDWQRKYWKCD